jgi:hypothetical protein
VCETEVWADWKLYEIIYFCEVFFFSFFSFFLFYLAFTTLASLSVLIPEVT